MIPCETCRQLLLDHLYGLLDPAEAAAVDAHLVGCSACATEHAQAARWQGLIATAATVSFPEAKFAPPVDRTAPLIEPVRPATLDPTEAHRSVSANGIRGLVAAVLLLAFAGLGGPAARDLGGHLWYHPTVSRELAALDQAQAERARISNEIARTKELARKRTEDAKTRHDDLIAEWVKAESTSLEAAASRPFHVTVIGPASALPGAPNDYVVSATDKAGKPKTVVLAAQVTDRAGKVVFAPPMPTGPVSAFTLRLPASVWTDVPAGTELSLQVSAHNPTDGTKTEVREALRLQEPLFTTFLATDKPMYRPGESVYFRSLTLDRTTFTPPNHEMNLRFDLKAPSGQPVPGMEIVGLAKLTYAFANDVVAGPDGKPVRGVGSGAFVLPADLDGGEYTLTCAEVPVNETQSRAGTRPLAVRKFIVNKYTPDKLDKKLEFDAKTYGPGDSVQAKIEVRDQARPLANAVLEYAIEADGQAITPNVAPASTDVKGNASIRFTLPKADEIREARLTVTVRTAAVVETLVRRIPLATRRLTVEFFPEGGDLVAGAECRVYFRATTTTGKPADVQGILTDGTKDVVPVRTLTDADHPGVNQGLGVFTFTPQAGKKYAVKLDKPVGIVPPDGGYTLPAAKASGVVLHVADEVTRPGQKMQVRLHAVGVTRSVLVGAYIRGRAVAHQSATLEPGKAIDLALDLGTTKLGGVTRVTVFEQPEVAENGRVDLKPIAERLVFRQPGEVLKLGFTASKPGAGPAAAFVPGDRVQLDLAAKNELDQPAAAILWAAVVNQSVLTMADEKSARQLPTHFLLAGEVQNPDDLEHADFLLTNHPKAAEALDLLLGTQGWRRFAEQAPRQFRLKFPGGQADHLLLASAVEGPVPAGWRDTTRRVFNEYWPRYEAAVLDLDTAEKAQQAGTSTGDLKTDLSRAEAEYQTRQDRFGNTAADLKYFDDATISRQFWLPLTLLVVFGAAGALAVARLRQTPGDPRQRPLTVGAIGLVLLGVFVLGSVAVTGLGSTRWRSAAAGLPQMDPYHRYGATAKTAAPASQVPPPAWAADAADPAAINNPNPIDLLGVVGGPMDGPKGFEPPPGGDLAAPDPARRLRFAVPGEDRLMEAEVLNQQMMRLGRVPEEALRKNLADQAHANGVPALRGIELQFGGEGIPEGRVGGFGDRAMRRGVRIEPGMIPVANDRLAKGVQWEAKKLMDFYAKGEAAGAPGYAFRQKLTLPEQARQAILAAIPRTPPLVVREYAHARPTPQPGREDTRTDFTETLLWQPLIVTPQDGKASVSFQLSDAVTGYQVLVAGHTLDGRLGSVIGTIEVRKPFSVDPKLPQEISSADVLDVPLVLTNETDTTLTADVRWTLAGMKSSTDGLAATMTPRGGARKYIHLNPTLVEGPLAVKLDAKSGPGLTDSVERTLTVVPDGFPLSGTASDMLEKVTRAPVKLPNAWIPGTLKVAVTVYPNTLSELQAGLDGLLQEPHGCFEQSSTANYPNVLIMSYLNESNQAKPDVAKRARDLMDSGYSRLTGYECPKTGSDVRTGFEWFGAQDRPHEALTAYGVLQFTDMSRVYPVDAKMLARTKQFLIDSRDGQGGFRRNSVALDTFGRAPDHITNAYIVWAVTEAEKDAAEKSDLTTEMNALFTLATKAGGKPAKDPYFLALVGNALLNRGRTADGIGLLKAVAGMQSKDGSVLGAETSITTSAGRDLLVETTAFAVLGWLKANRADLFLANTQAAMQWVGKQRSGGGSFGSTQATILALKALIEHARANKKPTESGELRVFVGGKEVGTKAFSTESVGPIVFEVPDADKTFPPGETEVRVETTAKQAYPLSVAWSCRTAKPNSSPACAVKVEAKLARNDVTEGESVRLDVRVENTTDKPHGMVVAIVGIPAGLKLPEDMKQLKDLIAVPSGAGPQGTGIEPTVSYWETRGRELVLYWRGMTPKQVVTFGLDLVANIPGEYRGPASRAYLYYNADHKHWVDPVRVKVRTKAGDAMADR